MPKEEARRKSRDETRRMSRDERTKKIKKKKKKKNIGLSREDVAFLQTNTRFDEKAIQDWYR